MISLGIETSCDDTSIGILKQERNMTKVLAHRTFGQEDILKKWGGVVPEIAARNHLQKLVTLLEDSLNEAELELKNIDLIGITTTPGLLGPLLTGLNAAKTLSLITKVPIVAVNHLYAHLEAIHITEKVCYPYLGILLSGGHSLFFLVTSHNKFQVLGSTIDDAAGEAFDKGGKLLGLGYPAGRVIDQLAKNGDPKRYAFPIGLKSSADARFSFSGLKTALRVFLEKHPHLEQSPSSTDQDFLDLCASYQESIIAAIKLKTRYALAQGQKLSGVKDLPIVVGGGVACNSALRTMMKANYDNSFFVDPRYCADNGAMIAHYALLSQNEAIPFPNCLKIDARGRYIDKKDFK